MSLPVATRPERPVLCPRWPWGLLGMLVVIGLVELTIAARHLDFTTVAADDWRRTARSAVTKAKDRDVLCFGDSLIKYGVLPRVIEAQTGLKTFNLAVNGGPMPAEYFLLKRTLAAGARPRAIVADFFPLMLADVPWSSVRVYPELATVADCLDLARSGRDFNLFSSLLLAKTLPSIRCRFEVRAALMGAFRGERASPWPIQRRIWTSWQNQLGAQPMPVAPGQPVAIPGLVADLTPDDWTIDTINQTYFYRFVTLAESYQIPIFWVIPPLGPEVESGRVARGTAAAYTRFAQAAQARHPHLIVLDARTAGYDGASHTDPIHLNEVGARILSADIGSAIADQLAGRSISPWADLPSYAGRGTTGAPTAAVASQLGGSTH